LGHRSMGRKKRGTGRTPSRGADVAKGILGTDRRKIVLSDRFKRGARSPRGRLAKFLRPIESLG
jgi:hypothetical protein